MQIEVPDILLGQLRTGGTEAGEDVKILAEHRFRGTLVVGSPGMGKSALLAEMGLQDIRQGLGVLIIDPHTMVQDVIARIPPERVQDVVVISFRHDESPLWPVLDVARKDDEQLLVAEYLFDAWRAQYGRESIQARAEAVLSNALLAIPRKSGISPVELLALLCLQFYRWSALGEKALGELDFGLRAYFQGTVLNIGERVFQEWAQSVVNKLLPLINYTWLRRATTGTPPGRGDDHLPVEILWDKNLTPPITRVTWVSDGKLIIERDGIDGYGVIQVDHELDRYLLDYVGGGTVRAPAFPESRPAQTKYVQADNEDPGLTEPTEEEIAAYGEQVVVEVSRRRRRRAWRRCVDYELIPRGIKARESIDIADLLDDGRIILVEIPKSGGPAVTQAAATFALLAAVIRGHRQTVLPERRKRPVSIYVDEAELFLTAGIEDTLQELRKANVAITLALQRFGQLDGPGQGLRQAVVNTVGSIVALGLGRGEIDEASKLIFEEDSETIRKLKKGEGILSTLSREWSHQDPIPFTFKALPPVQEDLSDPVRQASIARFHQPKEEADKTYISRVRAIMKTISTARPSEDKINK